MSFLDKMEQKYGRYAIRNLSSVIIAIYIAGYIIDYLAPGLLQFLVLHPGLIMRGEAWRLVSWVLVPPGRLGIFTVIMLYFYYSIGKVLERTWGSFRFNLYIISGVVFTVIGAFLLYYVGHAIGYYSTYYINLSIFLAFAATYPDMQVLLYFLIPIKMKWMGYLYGFFILMSMIEGSWADRVAILMSLLNFVIFFLSNRNMRRYRPKEIKRRAHFREEVKKAQPKSITRHKCAICGRSELDGEHLEFRFCSKCNGNYEYCQDHLFTHTHFR